MKDEGLRLKGVLRTDKRMDGPTFVSVESIHMARGICQKL